MAAKYEVGDKVQLNVGGPKMAVYQVNTNDEGEVSSYKCQWFAGKKLDSGYFPPQSLIPVPPDAPPAAGAPAQPSGE